MGMGSLDMVRQPMTFTVDSWAMRRNDLGINKPADFTVVTRNDARASVLQSIARIASEGDEFGRIENKGSPVVAQAQRVESLATATTDDLSVHFATPAEITWGGGGVRISYKSSIIDFRL